MKLTGTDLEDNYFVSIGEGSSERVEFRGETYGDNISYIGGVERGNSRFMLSADNIWDLEVIRMVSVDLSPFDIDQADNLINNNTDYKTKARNDLEMCYRIFCNTNELEALSHDILHYWLYSKENIQLQSISESIGSSFREVENMLGDIGEGLNSLPSFLKYINDDAKLNKISKYAIDRYYYQSFVYNNINNRQGILNLENSFREQGAFLANKELENLKKELCKKSISRVYNDTFELSNTGRNNPTTEFRTIPSLDIIRLGIKYDLAKEILDNKILHIKINIVNHKFPDIYFKPLNYYYLPCFTNFLPFIYRLAKEQNNFQNIDPFDFIGYFNHNVKSLEKRISILSKDVAIRYIENIVRDTNFENTIFEPGEGLVREDLNIYEKIYRDHAMSNAIKYCDYVKQKVFNEKDLNAEALNTNNILSPMITSLYENMSESNFKKIFLKEKSDFENIINLDNGTIDLLSNTEVINSQFYAYDFFKMLDNNISMTEFAKIFTDDIYYDVFNIKISRGDLINRIDKEVYNNSDYSSSNNYNKFILDLITQKELNVGYTFIIEANTL